MSEKFNQYHAEVDSLLKQHCGIGVDDTSPELVDSCYANNESAKECFEQIVEKYDLDTY